MNCLDVGCGSNPRGDVCIDLFYPYNQQKFPIKYNGDFVNCDAQHLPFKNNSFDRVYSCHVLEHVPDPQLMLKEIVRVSRDKVEISVPRFKSSAAVSKYHLHFFDEGWFRKNNGGFKIDALYTTLNPVYSHEHLLALLLFRLGFSSNNNFQPLYLLVKKIVRRLKLSDRMIPVLSLQKLFSFTHFYHSIYLTATKIKQ